jgi:hypothetical protein
VSRAKVAGAKKRGGEREREKERKKKKFERNLKEI